MHRLWLWRMLAASVYLNRFLLTICLRGEQMTRGTKYGLASCELHEMTGIDPGHFSRWMRGQRTLSQDALDALCKALRLRVVRAADIRRKGGGVQDA